MVRAALATLAMLVLHTPSLSVAVDPSSGSAVDVLTVLCGTAAAESVGGMLDSLLFHRSVPLRLHIVADEAARRALPNPRPPRTASGGAVALVQTQYTEAEDALSSLSSLPELADTPVGCSALPLFAAHLLPTAQRAIVLAPEVIVLADIADLWQYFAHLEASAAYIGAVVDQSSWYTDHPEWAGAQGDSVNGAVLLLDLRAMRAVDWSGLVKQAKAAGQSLQTFGDRGFQDTLNTLQALESLKGGSVLHRLGCQWNVQMTEGTSLCSRTSGQADTGCQCMPPRIIYKDPTADTIGHPLRSTVEFWAQGALAVSREYLFHPQPLLLHAQSSTATVPKLEEEPCAGGWTGVDCDKCAPGYHGDMCERTQHNGIASAKQIKEACRPGWTGQYCDRYIHDDTACREGWAGEDCDECAPGYTGDLCDQRVSATAAVDDSEEACSEGWAGEDCDECAPGYTGDRCLPVGSVDACAAGWAGVDCDVCTPGVVGDMCDSSPAELQAKWSWYRDMHASAVAEFRPCSGFACYNVTMQADLEPFGELRSIPRSAFDHARTYNMERTQGKGRMNHYQILGGKL